jgi:hypothetical protein
VPPLIAIAPITRDAENGVLNLYNPGSPFRKINAKSCEVLVHLARPEIPLDEKTV